MHTYTIAETIWNSYLYSYPQREVIILKVNNIPCMVPAGCSMHGFSIIFMVSYNLQNESKTLSINNFGSIHLGCLRDSRHNGGQLEGSSGYDSAEMFEGFQGAALTETPWRREPPVSWTAHVYFSRLGFRFTSVFPVCELCIHCFIHVFIAHKTVL